VKFNINETVRVRLTDYGRAALREDWDSMTEMFFASPERSAALRGEYKPPKEDEDGWSNWQLWRLMQAFGDRMNVVLPLCFETEIEIVGAEVAKAEAERDEARRAWIMHYCATVVDAARVDIDPNRTVRSHEAEEARRRGWNCFKNSVVQT
jgi:hypothetical protein